ncbi:MAG: hypothetical protein LBM75_10725, partial [Myxococcales bacterium]|nr:hypothetical protein [Myxococcales bacterium]
MTARPAFRAFLCALLSCATTAWADESAEAPTATVTVTTAPATAATAPRRLRLEQHPVVASVELSFPESFRADGLAELVSIQPGDRLTRREVQRTIGLIFATGKVSDVRALERQHADGSVELIFELVPRHFIAADQIVFQGNARLSEAQLRKATRLIEDRFEYFPENLDLLVQDLQATYARIGHNQLAVRHELTSAPDGAERLVISIDEGAPSKIQDISFAGRPGLSDAELFSALGLALGDVLDLDRLKQGIDALRQRYRTKGYYQFRIGQ